MLRKSNTPCGEAGRYVLLLTPSASVYVTVYDNLCDDYMIMSVEEFSEWFGSAIDKLIFLGSAIMLTKKTERGECDV